MKTTHLLVAAVLITVALVAPVQAARPVARWDVIPDQRIDAPFKAGVVAFHPDGAKVEFRVNGALVHTANDPTYNDRTDVWEYWFTFDPSGYADGAVIVDARAIPLNGSDPSYDLPVLDLYANAGGTLGSPVVKWADAVNGSDSNSGAEAAPYQTLAMAVSNTPAGGTVYLKAGTYESDNLGGGSREYWTTIAAAEGLGWDDVEIASGFPATNRLKLVNLSIFTERTSGYITILNGSDGVDSTIWLDNVKSWNKNGRWGGGGIVTGNGYIVYTTGGLTTQLHNGGAGRIVRNHHVQSITADVFSGGNKLVVNCTADDTDPGDTGAHPDFHQSYAPSPNWCEDVILYNVKGTKQFCQGFFGYRLRNAAFVNVLFEAVPSVFLSRYSGEMVNDLWFHVNIIDQWWFWDESLAATGVALYNNVFGSMGEFGDVSTAGMDIDSNHFYSQAATATTMGTNVTGGDAMFAGRDWGDYHLLPSSPAFGTGRHLQCVPADINGVPYDPIARNRGCYAGEGVTTDPPTADAGADQTVDDTDADGREDITLDGSGSLDTDGTIDGYVWTEDASQIATGVAPTASFKVGAHTVTLTVTDNIGASGVDTVVITITGNFFPIADAGADRTATDFDGDGSEDVTLDGSNSSDPDGTIVSYVWSEDASQIATGVTPTVNLVLGIHAIELTVTDDQGAADTDSVVIDVAPGLVAYWPFNGSGSTATDASGNGHDGTIISATRVTGALSFDEVDDYVQIPDWDYTNIFNEFSINFFFKIDDVAGTLYQYMFSHGALMDPGSINIYVFEDQAVEVPQRVRTLAYLNDGARLQIDSPTLLADGQWHMYTLTVSADTGAVVYIDGASVGTHTGFKDAAMDPATDIYLGGRCDLDANRFFGATGDDDGLLDELSIFDRPLDSAEVSDLFANGRTDPGKPGDADGDGDVDLDDFVILKTNFGASPLDDPRADFDGDGDVDLDDFVILKTNFGT